MLRATHPPDEVERLAALLSYRILDSNIDETFDSITELAAYICDVPIALVNFVDRDRQWFKSAFGLTGIQETPRDTGFCAHAILSPELMEVQDATRDERFADNPFVIGEPEIRFYAGMPLIDAGGHKLGTLCVIDRRPRTLEPSQRKVLLRLSKLVISLLEKRRSAMTSFFHLNAILDLAFDEIYLLDPRDARYVYANSRACLHLERTLADLQTRTADEIDPDLSPTLLANLLAAQTDGAASHLEYRSRHIRYGGQSYPVQVRIQPVEMGDDQLIAVVASDISSQMHAERSLRREQGISRTLLESLAEGVVACDITGKMTIFNRTARDWLGGAEVLDMPGDWSELRGLHSLDNTVQARGGRAPLACALRGERVRGAMFSIAGAGRVTRFVSINADPMFDETGELIGAVAVFHDVTESRLAEERRRRSEERYRKLVESSPDIIFIHYNGIITFMNRAGIRLLGGASADDFVGKPVREFLHPDFHHIAGKRIKQMLETGQEAEPLEELFYRMDGTTIALEVAATAIFEDRRPAIQVVARDITERKRVSEALRSAETRYHSIFENATEGIFQADPTGSLLSANPALALIYGYEDEEQMMLANPDVFGRIFSDGDAGKAFLQQLHEVGRVTNLEVTSRRADQSHIWVSLSAREVHSAEGVLQYVEGSVQEITQNKIYQQELLYQANHDTLTGMPNRNLLQDRLSQALMSAGRYGRNLVVAFVDLDNFKFINDSLGHRVGDDVLLAVAQRLSGCIRETDTAARVGGDEFVLVLSDQDDGEGTPLLLQRVLDRISEPIVVGESAVEVACSIGASVFPEDGTDSETLLIHADIAMYRAKEQGRNNIQFFTSDMNARIRNRIMIESRLRGALGRGEFRIAYQPQIDLATGRVIGVEALLRWRNAQLGTVQPNDFIPLAEETGLIVPIGEWVLREACTQAAAWQAQGFPDLTVSVNLSLRQFHQRGLVDMVGSALTDSGLAPDKLELELTESSMMQNLDEVVAVLNTVKAMGVRLSIDDFGTGYSSLSYLHRLPFDALKIDRSFINGLDDDSSETPIVKAMIALARNLHLRVIAEGVETQRQFEFLREQRADAIQGFYISKAVSAQRLTRFLQTFPS